MATKKRHAKSKVHRMQPDARAWIDAQLRADRLTLNELMAELGKRWPNEDLPSRTGLHRYQSGVRELGERMREIDAAANALVGELGEGIGEKSGALLAQAVTTLATNAALLAQDRDDVSIDEVRKLARAARDVIDTRRISLAERQSIEKAARDKMLREQNTALESVVKSAGLTPETADQLRRQLLGIRV